MTILFDLSGLQSRTGAVFHGGAEYIRAVLKAVLEHRREERLVALVRREYPKPTVLGEWLGAKTPVLEFSNSDEISGHLDQLKPDVFFSGLPYSYASVRLPGTTRGVYTIHGLREIECPTDRYQVWFESTWKRTIKTWLQGWNPAAVVKKETAKIVGLLNALRPQDSVIAVSEHTRWALENLHPDRSVPVMVAYSPPKVAERYSGAASVAKPYFLMVSANRWVKNPIRGILAFDSLIERFGGRYPEMTLKVTGRVPQQVLSRLRHPERVEVLGYVEESELERLYCEAWALFYPSLNEGFGYPPLEAMKYGTPVLSSAVCSLTEVCGTAALFFDPRDMREMQDRMLAILDPDVRHAASLRSMARQAEIEAKQERDLKWLAEHLLDRTSKHR